MQNAGGSSSITIEKSTNSVPLHVTSLGDRSTSLKKHIPPAGNGDLLASWHYLRFRNIKNLQISDLQFVYFYPPACTMDSQRPKRNSKLPKRFLDSAPSVPSDNQVAQKMAKRKQQNAPLKPIAVETVPNPTLLQSELPHYIPPLEYTKRGGHSLVQGLTQLQLFLQFFSTTVMAGIVVATNSYGERTNTTETINRKPDSPHHRKWHATTISELYRYLGILLFIGLRREPVEEKLWNITGYNLGQYMGLKRYQQLSQYFTLRDLATTPLAPSDEWFAVLEPVATHLRTTCKKLWYLETHVAIDEAIIAYRGRTKHTIKIKNKPISEGYKVWVLAEAGYVWTWLWHSKIKGPEKVPKEGTKNNYLPIPQLPIHLSATFVLVLRLAREVHHWYNNRIFTVFLDNLFLNVDVAQALLVLGFLCMGTTRKNAKGIPQALLDLKEHNRALIWNSCIGITVSSVLCFLWQDNNAVLGITTAYGLHLLIKRLRTRPSTTSTNAHIVLPVFGDLKKKELEIPYAIDEYNHHMNGVDRNNQLRKRMSVIRPYQERTWRPAWYWMLDVVLVNCYLIWKSTKRPDRSGKGHRRFRQTLYDALLNWPDEPSDTMALVLRSKASSDCERVRFKVRGHCVVCSAKISKLHKHRRRFGTDIINEAAGGLRKRGTRTPGGCSRCRKHLCIMGDCWKVWHSQNK